MAKELCFDGSVDSGTRLYIGAHGLTEFSIEFDVQFNGCGEGLYNSSQWHSGGCSLVSAVRGRRRDRIPWWVERREAPAVGPREDLVQPRGGSPADVRRRNYLDAVLAVGSRSDWGVSATPDGRVMFGIGHRNFGFSSETAGMQRASARPIRDLTVTTTDPLPDGWHRVRCERSRRANLSSGFSPHDTSDLGIFVDDVRQETTFAATGGRTSDAAARQAAHSEGGSPGFGGSAPPHPLEDATYHVPLGELFKGCIKNVRLSPTRRRSAQRRIPMYFYAHADNESRQMVRDFAASLRDDIIELREQRAELVPQAERYATKMALVLRALRENPLDSIVLVSDLDIRFFKPVADYILTYTADVDLAFQRDEDRSLQVNLGFMALRNNAAVYDLFRVVADVLKKKNAGDQRIINRALAQPWFFGTPRLRWRVFPPELLTNTIVDTWRTDNMYGANLDDCALFHANDYGRATLDPARARSAKLKLLNDVQRIIARHPDAPSTTRRWGNHHNQFKRPGGDLP